MIYRRKEIIGNAILYEADCLGIMAQFKNKEMDAVVTDPPYGINQDGKDRRGANEKNCRVFKKQGWDEKIPDLKYFIQILRISKQQAIFGGNFFSNYLPNSRGWLYWDKKIGSAFADGELIYTSRKGVLKSFSYCSQRPGNVHPTQKPLPVMEWVILQLEALKEGSIIIDPYMGSGSTGVACYNLGYLFIGIENNSENFDNACARIQKANNQKNLF